MHLYNLYIKRILDIIICLIGLPVFILLYIFIGLLIKLEDGGSIFYKDERIGKGNILYFMYKFRSMKSNSPNILNADGSTFNSINDSRVTKIGKIIRATSIDETPQIINVLKGDMSIIGPRASQACSKGTFSEDEIDKMKVKPGITGYSQAYYRNAVSSREKRLKDAWYANNVTFKLDMKILFKTVITVIARKGLYTSEDTQSKDSISEKSYL